jgi:hypothetical protein
VGLIPHQYDWNFLQTFLICFHALNIVFGKNVTCMLMVRNFLQLQGGMSNELYNSIARVTDGIYEGSL